MIQDVKHRDYVIVSAHTKDEFLEELVALCKKGYSIIPQTVYMHYNTNQICLSEPTEGSLTIPSETTEAELTVSSFTPKKTPRVRRTNEELAEDKRIKATITKARKALEARLLSNIKDSNIDEQAVKDLKELLSIEDS